jgi:hypothetical protein
LSRTDTAVIGAVGGSKNEVVVGAVEGADNEVVVGAVEGAKDGVVVGAVGNAKNGVLGNSLSCDTCVGLVLLGLHLYFLNFSV